MREDEAKTKRCPFVRAVAENSDSGQSNRWKHEADPNDNYCIGSACMLWRWSDMAKQHGYCGGGGRP